MPGVMSLREFTGTLTKYQDRHNSLIHHENAIRRDMARVQECFVYIGYRLLDINDSKLYDCIYYQGSGDYCKNIYQYAAQELDICKSTTYQLMTVAQVFSERGLRTGLKPRYKDYSFSQLVELSSVPVEFHEYCDPHMSIKTIREWKQGKKVSCAFGSIGIREGYSSKFGLFRYFQIPPELFAKFQTSGMDADEAKAIQTLPGQVSVDNVLNLPDMVAVAEPPAQTFQTSGTEAKIKLDSGGDYVLGQYLNQVVNYFITDIASVCHCDRNRAISLLAMALHDDSAIRTVIQDYCRYRV